MASYWIEKAGSDWVCKVCRKPLRRGSECWGIASTPPRWYHLACALAARPAGFATFAPFVRLKVAAATPSTKGRVARSPKLEAAILAAPKDRGAIAVLGDWLQEQGDPWGELIALSLARRRAAVELFLAARMQDLAGSLDSLGAFPQLTWRDGLIRAAAPRGDKPTLIAKWLTTLFGLRTAFAIDKVQIGKASPEVIRALAGAPRGLRTVILKPYGPGLAKLAHPTVVRLEITAALKPPELAALVASPLFARIEQLGMARDDVDDAVRAAVRARRDLKLVAVDRFSWL
jgi:uncharacterized protein (TIGR02996 family)